MEVFYLTNINCSSNCIYQKDGKCNFENISETKFAFANKSNTECAYFSEKTL